MKKFLLVEDSPIVVKIIKHICGNDPALQCDIATSFAEAKALLQQHGKAHYLVAVVDLNLPDAPHGEVADFTIAAKIPTIVLTGNYSDDTREQMLEKRIVDYVVKESRFSYEYVLKLIKRLHKNQSIKILVADDSKVSRNMIAGLLQSHLFQVATADDGDTALAMIREDPDIKLLITDYNMPRMNGFDLVRNIRKEVDKNDLVIVGLSGEGDSKLSAKFIKNGANDFLSKPFSQEEFHCRILQDIENMEMLQSMKHYAYHDWVTGLPNKRHLFEEGADLLDQARQNGSCTSLAILSIDKLSDIQNRYGLDACDQTQKALAAILPKAFSRFQVARLSDSDIAVLMVGLNSEQAFTLTDNFREIVEDHIVLLDELSFNFTISGGVYSSETDDLREMIKQADNRLYTARDEGGNQVCYDE